MITAITLENFKGIGDTIRIPLRPITLMFGANSSGKSTVLHAIHYAREVLERGNLNPDRTMAGGNTLDLGGFRTLVHNHDLNNSIMLRFDLDLTDTDLRDYRHEVFEEAATNISQYVETAWVELHIEWSRISETPVLRFYRVGINGDPIAIIETSPDGKNCRTEYNTDHSLFLTIEQRDSIEKTSEKESQASSGWNDIIMFDGETFLQASPPPWGKLLYVLGEDVPDGYTQENFSPLMTQIITGPGEILRDWLRKFRYLGPIRNIPSRTHQPSLTPDESRWADGLAAWDALYLNRDEIVDKVDTWLSADRLNSGYRVTFQSISEVPTYGLFSAGLASENLFVEGDPLDDFNSYPTRTKFSLVEDASDVEVQLQDVGVGISQVIPVLVAALGTNEGIVAMEQPELHLHPAMQAELGDLFIVSALGNLQNNFLLETHSEHLILRLLRRIRETTELSLESPELKLTPNDVQVVYVRREADQINIYDLEIAPDGEFVNKWPDGFFPERAKELF